MQRFGSFVIPPIAITILVSTQHIFIRYPGKMESITLSDSLVGQVVLCVIVVISYGQAVVTNLSGESSSYLALVNQKEYGTNSWFLVCIVLNWLFMLLAVMGMRYKEHLEATTPLQSNHLLLKHTMEFAAIAGIITILVRILTWQYVTIAFLAQYICYMLLISVFSIIAKHEECLQFAIRKWRSYPFLSVVFHFYDIWVPMLIFFLRRNQYIHPIELIV